MHTKCQWNWSISLLAFSTLTAVVQEPLGWDVLAQAAPVRSASPSATTAGGGASTTHDLSAFPIGTVIDHYGDAVLSEVNTTTGPLRVLVLTGSPTDVGYQYGRLVGTTIPATWQVLMDALGSELGMSASAAERKFGPVLDRAYGQLEPYISGEFRSEIDAVLTGTSDSGAASLGSTAADVRTLVKRMIALSNISDLSSSDLNKLLFTGTSEELDAFYQGQRSTGSPEPVTESDLKLLGKTCAFFAAWGDRTQDGHLIAARNLDWADNTRLRSQALLTVYNPSGGSRFATFGYAGFLGAFAGMNEHGLVVAEVGASSSLEKLKGQPWTLRLREVLAHATSVSEAIPYLVNQDPGDRVNRPTTLGYNFMVAQGDPAGRGTDARAAVFESNGGQTQVYELGSATSGCKTTATLFTYGRDGRIARTDTPATSGLVNTEQSAYEVDAAGKGRRFLTNEGQFVRDAQGYYIEDPYDGSLMYVGSPQSCSVFRGEEAFGLAIRMYQLAANGPQGVDPRLVMSDSESYNDRYLSMSSLLHAIYTGGSYTDAHGMAWYDGQGSSKALSLLEGELISRAAAMDSNIMNVVYDATELTVRIGLDGTVNGVWTPASENAYTELALHELFAW